jgi:uncharacterized protein (DUF2164 family)
MPDRGEENIMANPIFDKVIKALDGLATLNVETVVVDKGGNKAIKTEMDLIGGDIRTRIDKDFISGELTSIREFHNQQVTNAREVVSSNIAAMVDLAEKIGDKIEEYTSASSSPSEPAA